jgi:putative membrane protein
MTIKPFRSNTSLQGIVLWLVALWIVTAINPLYPRDWLLENLLVFTWGALLVFTYRRFQFSKKSNIFLTVIISFDLAGGHNT